MREEVSKRDTERQRNRQIKKDGERGELKEGENERDRYGEWNSEKAD